MDRYGQQGLVFGHELIVVMEFLAGGSCLDLVLRTPSLLTVVKTRSHGRTPYRYRLQRDPRRFSLPTPTGEGI